MATDSLFEPLAGVGTSAAKTVDITFNGAALQVPAGVSVAAALLAVGVRRFRQSPPSGAGRAPYCMMGACFDCLLEIDGVPNRQACLQPVQPGMQIRTQDSLPDTLTGESHPALALTQAMDT